MKTKFLMAAFLCAAVCLTSCDGSDSKLAGELVGTWKGSTTEMTKGKKDKPDKEGRKSLINPTNAKATNAAALIIAMEEK